MCKLFRTTTRSFLTICRNLFLRRLYPKLSLGSNIRICSGFRCSRVYPTYISDGVFIGFDFYSSVPLKIGRKVMIAPRVSIVGGDHELSINDNFEMIDMPRPSADFVHIGDGAWIGCGSCILHGVRIGNGSVIGAGSVVTKNVPANYVVAGNPAKPLYSRHER